AGTTQLKYVNSRLSTSTDPAGNTIRYEYSPSGLLTAVIEPGDEKTIYEYDAQSNLVGIQDAMGRHVTYSYDALGQLIAETHIHSAEAENTELPISPAPTVISPNTSTAPSVATIASPQWPWMIIFLALCGGAALLMLIRIIWRR